MKKVKKVMMNVKNNANTWTKWTELLINHLRINPIKVIVRIIHLYTISMLDSFIYHSSRSNRSRSD